MAALDMVCSNPWSRLTLSEFSNIHILRETIRRQLHGARAVTARSSLMKPARCVVKGASYVFLLSIALLRVSTLIYALHQLYK